MSLTPEEADRLAHVLFDGLDKIVGDYPQVSSPAVHAGVIGDFHGLLIQTLEDFTA